MDDGQLALYLVFTLLSLLASLLAYCFYHHAFHLGQQDYEHTVSLYAKISQLREPFPTVSPNLIERPLID